MYSTRIYTYPVLSPQRDITALKHPIDSAEEFRPAGFSKFAKLARSVTRNRSNVLGNALGKDSIKQGSVGSYAQGLSMSSRVFEHFENRFFKDVMNLNADVMPQYR
jgi:hypothetical protein